MPSYSKQIGGGEFFQIRIDDPSKGASIAKMDEDQLKLFQSQGRRGMNAASRVLLGYVRDWLRISVGTYDPAQAHQRYGLPPQQNPQTPTAEQLAESFKTINTRVAKYRITGGVYSAHPGAARVEWGTTDVRGITTDPHPYMNPATKEAEPVIHQILEGILEAAG